MDPGISEERSSALFEKTCWSGCLLGVVATLYFLTGLAGHVHSRVLNLLVSSAVAGGALYFLAQFFAIPTHANRLGRLIWTAVWVILTVEILLGLLPPTARDELTHHLAIPKLYVQAGRIIEVPMAPYAYYPMLLDMLYTPWIHWGHDFVAKQIHLLFGFLTGVLIYAYLTRRMSSVYGLLGFFFFMSTPAILRLSHSAYIDLGITFYCTASLMCLLCWREERQASRWLVLAALSLGFALATKPNGLLACLVMSLVFTWIVAMPPRTSLRTVAAETAQFAVLTSLPFLPWLIKNWVQTGNPFYPLLGRFFSSDRAPVLEPGSFVELGLLAKRELLYGESIWQIVGLPLRVFFFGQDDNPQYFDGVLTPVLIVFLPWAFKGKWREEKKLIAAFVFCYFLYALFLVDLRIRYILPVVPALVLLLVYGIFNLYASIRRPVLLAAVLLFFSVWHGSYVWRYLHPPETLPYLTGRETRGDYLARKLPEYPAMHYISRQLPSSAKIYLLFLGRRAYYCDRAYFHDPGELPAFLMRIIQQAKDPHDIERSLGSRNLTHLMAHESLLVRFLRENLTEAQSRAWEVFAVNHLKLAFRQNGYAVYQIDG